MRKVNKDFNNPPQALQDCFSQKEINLLENKTNHSFDSRCYNQSVINELKDLYHNKCAYCESFLLNNITIEHYRPKKNGYYWLGYEWSNLLPTCTTCNNSKGDKFEISGIRIREPFKLNGKLDLNRCKADCDEFLNEKPLIIHPEIDEPKDFFYFDETGSIKPKDENLKAKKTIEILKLDNQSLLLKRKKVIDDLFFSLESSSIRFLEYLSETNNIYTENELKLAFFPLYDKLIYIQNEELEFTLLSSELLDRFDYFFLDKIERNYSKELKNLIQQSFLLYIKIYLQK
ncbi:MAG: retron system putative HNH endonuclease [Cyanobacteriota bacterium]